MAQQISTNTFGVAKWIVSPTAYLGTHTTIATALTSASSGDVIWVLPGTYTENFNAKAGITLSAAPGSENGAVTIVGKCSANITGTMNFNNLVLQTNGDYMLVTSGSGAMILNYTNCNFNNTNFGFTNHTNSNAASAINIYNCKGDFATSGLAFMASSCPGTSIIQNTTINNTGATTGQPISMSAGLLKISGCDIFCGTQTTSGGQINIEYSTIDTSATNSTSFSSTGTGGLTATGSLFSSGTAVALTFGSGTTGNLYNITTLNSNTNTITGSGTVNYTPVSFAGTSNKITTTTQNVLVSGFGGFKGLTTGTPGTGYLGEQIRSAIASGSAVSLTTATAANVTSISLTAGIWDVTGVVMLKGVVTGTASGASIGTTSATTGTQGDNYITTPTVSTTLDLGVVVPPYRISLTTTTTVYLVGIAIFTVGTQTAYGRISATRVG